MPTFLSLNRAPVTIAFSIVVLSFGGFVFSPAVLASRQDTQSEQKKDDSSTDKKQDNKSDQKTDEKSVGNKQDDDKSKTDNKTQETETPAVESNAEETIESLKKEFQKIREDLIIKKTVYAATSDSEEQLKLYAEFMAELDRANQQVEKIQKLALEELKSNPSDEPSIKTLVGIMINFAEQDNGGGAALTLGDNLIRSGVDSKYYQTALEAPRLSLFGKEIIQEIILRDAEFRADDLPRVKISTTKGDIVVELFENEAPDTVGNFVSLVEAGFYSNSPFHRVMENFMAQAGRPAEGTQDIDYTIYCECNKISARRHYPGCLSMAKTTMPNTGSSEFFLCFTRRAGLDNQHTVFGRIIEGMENFKNLSVNVRTDPTSLQEVPVEGAETDKILNMEIVRKREHEYKPNKVSKDVPENSPADLTKGNLNKDENKKDKDEKANDSKANDKTGDNKKSNDDKDDKSSQLAS